MTGRTRLGWSDLPGRRVGIYGLGVEGRASIAACRARGIEPVVVDDTPIYDETLGAAPLPTADGGLAELLRCEVVVKAPGISRYGETARALLAAGVTVVGGTGLWLADQDLARVLVVTGTKGKSTTSSIAGHLVRGLGFRVLLGGNIGIAPFAPGAGGGPGEYDYAVVEVSSYQAAEVAVSPPVTAVTALNPDHLPWHGGDVETYYRDKLSVTSQAGADMTVANGDSPLLRAHRALLGPRVEWVGAGDDPGGRWMDGLGLPGAHNRRNALIAARALARMGVPGADDPARLASAAMGFAPLPSRLTSVGRLDGVDFVDDNLATNVVSALAGIAAFDGRRLALLLGGQSRGIDYRPLAEALSARTDPLLVVSMPTNGKDISRLVRERGLRPGNDVIDASSLAEAVRIAAEWAAPDGVVLLSPAAPSQDLFANYQERGAAFAKLAADLGARLPPGRMVHGAP